MADKKKNSTAAKIKNSVTDAAKASKKSDAAEIKNSVTDAAKASINPENLENLIQKEEEEEPIDAALFEKLDESEEDFDVEEQRLAYAKYIELAEEIDEQLCIIEDLRDSIGCIQEKPCLSPLDRQDLKQLRDCLFDESNTLESMKFKADRLINGECGICLCCYDLALPEPLPDDYVPKKWKPNEAKTADEICCKCHDTDSEPCICNPDNDSESSSDFDTGSDSDSMYSDTYSEECLKIRINAMKSALITKYLAWRVSCWEEPNYDI